MAFVPTKDAEFAAWADNRMGITEAHLEEFPILTSLKSLHTPFKVAYAKVLDPNRGPVDIADTNNARGVFEKALQGFIKAFLEYSPFVSDHRHRELGLPPARAGARKHP
jgi:hypothetical protein